MAEPLGSAPGIIVGVGVGAAASTALEAAVELPRQKVWADNPNKLLDPSIVARLVAQGAVELADGRADAKREGFTAEKFDQLVYLSQTVPAIAEAMTLWRKNLLSDGLFTHVLTKAGLDNRYVQPIIKSRTDERLAPAQVALGVVRSLLDSQGMLVGENDVTGGVIAPTPVSPINPVTEAGTWGISQERLRVLINEIGLPMALQAAANAVFRGIIKKPDFYLAVAQGDTRPAWADAIFEQARQIPSAQNFVENHLRGYSNADDMRKGAALHGMSPDDVNVLFQNAGRPLNVHQITTGLARGGQFNPEPGEIADPFLAASHESNIKPSYYDLNVANRYTLPTAFEIRGLLQGGAITAARGEELYLQIGRPPDLAKLIAEFFAAGTAAVADPHVTKAENSHWTKVQNSYIAGEIDEQQARAELTYLGVTGAAQDHVITTWSRSAAMTRKQLTPAQLKKAYQKGSKNDATGQPWTQDEVVAELVDRGYSVTDARSYLNIP